MKLRQELKMYHSWPVVPFCERQLLDIDPKDVLPGGVFRICDVYKSGGGYDKFPQICEKRFGRKVNPVQFVVQLRGCHLKCSYCYVTPEGIWGEDYINFSPDSLIEEFLLARKSMNINMDVFHLMGGAPGLYLSSWPELIDLLSSVDSNFIFHSDLLLTEKLYNIDELVDISQSNCLYAVNIKGVTPEDYKRNTGCSLDPFLLWENLNRLVMCNVPFYMTFTNPDMNHYDSFIERLCRTHGEETLKDSFIIDLIDYDALKK